jgi:hypothetical protein
VLQFPLLKNESKGFIVNQKERKKLKECVNEGIKGMWIRFRI